MSAASCRVRYTEVEGIEHAVEVEAESLYEAVALAETVLRGRPDAGSGVLHPY